MGRKTEIDVSPGAQGCSVEGSDVWAKSDLATYQDFAE